MPMRLTGRQEEPVRTQDASAPVTVVIPAYNRSETLGRAIASVHAQTLRPRQIIVVDDASTDGTAQAAEAAGAEVIRLSDNGGAAHARNQGIQAATEPWISFLDSDDEWLPHHLTTLWPYTKDFELVSAGRLSTREGLNRRRRRIRFDRPPETFDDPANLIFPDNPISLGATLVSRRALTDVGGFDESLRTSEDFDLWLRIVALHPAIVIPEPVYLYHIHPGQKTHDVPKTRAAQIDLLERHRSAVWWDEAIFQKRIALSSAESLIADGKKVRAAISVLGGLLRQPRAYSEIVAVLARSSLATRLERSSTRERMS